MDDQQPFGDPGSKLLPAGLADGLPPEAGHESMLVARLVARFAAQGYALVKPPLVEFEESLLSGIGAALRQHCFRLMDPVSQRMMGVRPDITPQVARIARTRLARAPRPLRLCYAGEVLRVRGTQLRPTRQFEQVGAEVIGASSAAADAEAVVLGAGALEAIGVAGLSVDLCVPTLVPQLAEALGLAPGQVTGLRAALDRKDIAAVETALAGTHARAIPTVTALLRATGAADQALAGLRRLDLPPAAAAERDRLTEVVELVRRAMPALTLTIDPVEMRGFEYDIGVSFTFFARGVHGELGRGGRYMAAGAEPSTGFTLFMDAIAPALPPPPAPRRAFLPLDTPQPVGAALRAEGWTTVAGLDAVTDAPAEARRQGCTHCWRDGAVVAV
ncbi:MAG: ATP phosphoribosyltransferase regulatory subunit [Alphaproteobacteria bacterium]|nr:ATP phosphoribosyltransferase regulatory subunit [Alphaproteobacteria bacterium]